METQNTKLKIYHKAIAKRYMPFLPIPFHCSGPWSVKVQKSDQTGDWTQDLLDIYQML